MNFLSTPLAGVWLIEPEIHTDARGFFARMHCDDEFEQQGIRAHFVQTSLSFNTRKGTLRGMHWQAAPHEERKLVRCVQGEIYDVVVDLRRDSPTFRQWFAAELSSINRRSLFIPEGCAHGFQTRADRTEVIYQITANYSAASARGVRWDDPAFRISWPACDDRTISDRDATFPDFDE